MGDIYEAASLSFELNTGVKIPAVGLDTWQAPPGVVGCRKNNHKGWIQRY